MKKKTVPISKSISYLRVYIDDIEKFYALLNEISTNVEFELGDYKIENVAEISQIHDEKITDFKIISKDPYIVIDYSDLGARIYVSNPDASQELVINKIEKILIERRNGFFSFIDKNYTYFSVFAGILVFVTLLIQSHFSQIAALIITVMFFLSVVFITGRKSSIIMSYKKDYPSFFSRNKDDILISIIFLILGWVLSKFL